MGMSTDPEKLTGPGAGAGESNNHAAPAPAPAGAALKQALRVLLQLGMLACLLFFVGYWMAKPTAKGTTLDYNLMDDVMSPSFGMGASWELVFTAPFIVLVVLATLYLQLTRSSTTKKLSNPKSGKPRVSLWTYPVFTQGPLGIVTAADLIMLVLFLLLNVWVIVWFETVGISNIDYGFWMDFAIQKGTMYTRFDIRVDYTGYYFGILGFVAMAFLFFPVCRGSALLRLLNIPFEHAVKYHTWVGFTTIFIFLVHTVIYYAYWWRRGEIGEKWKEWPAHHESNLAGLIAMVIGLVIAGTSIHQVRSRFFNFFFGTHQLYILFLIFTMLHIGEEFFYMIMAGVLLFTIDRFLRFIQSRKAAGLISVRSLPGDTTELVFAKHPSLTYTPTSCIFLNVPAVSRLQWHPFTLASSSLAEPDRVSILVKKQGTWTKNLEEVVNEAKAEASRRSCPFSFSIAASVEGPYGPRSDTFLRYDSLILVAGGSGIAPFVAILKDLGYRYQTQAPHTLPSHVTLIWAVRHADELRILDCIELKDSAFGKLSSTFCSQVPLDLQAYVTRQTGPDQVQQKHLALDGMQSNAIIPGPSLQNLGASREPVCPEPGTHSNWGHLAVVVASCAGFLFLWGLLGRYEMHLDVHHGYNFASKGMLNLLAMVMGVVFFGGATALGWERLVASRYRPPSGRWMPSPAGDIESSNYVNGNGEHKHRSDVGATAADRLLKPEDVHYGARPSMKAIFDEAAKTHSGRNVGVMVCGPPSMQQSVAEACKAHSSLLGTATVAFHYHSVSFEF